MNTVKKRSFWISFLIVILIIISITWWLQVAVLAPVSSIPLKQEVMAEVKLVIGEPYAQMLKDSTPKVIAQDIPNETWYNQVNEPAELHFNDPQYSFTTPTAKFLAVSYDSGVVDSVRMSPQIDTLNWDDAIKVVLNLQDQWRKGGWILSKPNRSPAYEDTPALRGQAKNNKSRTVFWSAGDKYQIMIFLQRFADSKRPNEERYLITMQIAKPWIPKE